MPYLNSVMLMGRLTADPQSRTITNGTTICNLRLAVNRRYVTAEGEHRDDVCFVTVETWGRQAESCTQYLRSGSSVMVEGRLRYDEWRDKDTGDKRSRLGVTAQRVHFLDVAHSVDSPAQPA